MNSNDRSQSPFDDLDQLDAYIDARNAGQPGERSVDGELAALFDAVDRIRSLRATPMSGPDADREFPERLAENLERELRATPREVFSTSARNHRGTAINDHAPATLVRTAAHVPIPIPERGRRDWVRPAFQFVAAVVAFALVAGVLAVVLRGGDNPGSQTGSGDDEPSDVGAVSELAPSESAGSGMATPAALTTTDWDEVQSSASFTLVVPTTVPEGFVLRDIVYDRDPALPADAENAIDWVQATYVDETSSSQVAAITFLQTTRALPEPDDDGVTTAHYLLNAVPIRKWIFTSGDVSNHEYQWIVGDVSSMVSAPIVGQITDPLLESFVASIALDDSPDASTTPDTSGAYFASTFVETQQVAGYELWVLEGLPSGVSLEGIRLETALDLSTGTMTVGHVDNVAASYLVEGSPGRIHYSQWRRGCNAPGMEDAETHTVDINGRQVERTLGTNGEGTRLAEYRMIRNGVCLSVFAMLTDVVTTDVLESVVALFPQTNTATPSSEKSAGFIIDHPVVTVTPDYGTCDDTVTVLGKNFTPGSTVAINGGQFPGHVFGQVAEDVVVDDNGIFQASLMLDRLISECGGGDATTEGAMFSVFANTGSSEVKSDVDINGPYAGTVFTFTRESPDAIRSRVVLPSCGTERQIIAWDAPDGERSPADQIARECFFEAWRSSQPAEFVSFEQTIEEGIVVDIYRTVGDGMIKVYHDGTRDPSGSGTWSSVSCGYLEFGDAPAYALVLIACGEEATIE